MVPHGSGTPAQAGLKNDRTKEKFFCIQVTMRL